MRGSLFIAMAVLLTGTGFAMSALGEDKPACAADNLSGCSRAWLNANLRINQIQIVGTSDSYKQRPTEGVLGLVKFGGSKKDVEELDYGQPPIPEQLAAGARTLDFAVAYDPQGGLFKNPAGASMAMEVIDDSYKQAMSKPGFKVIHVLDIDYRSSCLTLQDCLDQVASWSRTHKTHMPLVITLHANDTRTPMPGATKPVPFNAAAMDALDTQIRTVFTPGELITPDQVQGKYATLREAVFAHNWPRLGASRGKVIFVLDDCAEKDALYRGDRHNLEGRAMFTVVPEDSPVASFISIDDPRKDAARIAADVKAGFIVKTHADEETVEARSGDTSRRTQAFASGAQIIATDFIVPDSKIGAYKVTLADSSHPLCGIGSAAPTRCLSWAVAPQPPAPTEVLTAAR